MADLIAVLVICVPTLIVMFFAARKAIQPEPELPPPEAPRFKLTPNRFKR